MIGNKSLKDSFRSLKNEDIESTEPPLLLAEDYSLLNIKAE